MLFGIEEGDWYRYANISRTGWRAFYRDDLGGQEQQNMDYNLNHRTIGPCCVMM